MSRRRRQLVTVVAIATLLLGSTAVAGERLLLPDPDGEVLTLVLLGSDGGPPRGDQMLTARADGFQLLFVSGDRQHATFVSVPRDAYVSVASAPRAGCRCSAACACRCPQVGWARSCTRK